MIDPAEIRLWTYQNTIARAAYYADLAVLEGLCSICQESKCSPPTARTCAKCRYRRDAKEASA